MSITMPLHCGSLGHRSRRKSKILSKRAYVCNCIRRPRTPNTTCARRPVVTVSTANGRNARVTEDCSRARRIPAARGRRQQPPHWAGMCGPRIRRLTNWGAKGSSQCRYRPNVFVHQSTAFACRARMDVYTKKRTKMPGHATHKSKAQHVGAAPRNGLADYGALRGCWSLTRDGTCQKSEG
jgi:hypothetical protein